MQGGTCWCSDNRKNKCITHCQVGPANIILTEGLSIEIHQFTSHNSHIHIHKPVMEGTAPTGSRQAKEDLAGLCVCRLESAGCQPTGCSGPCPLEEVSGRKTNQRSLETSPLHDDNDGDDVENLFYDFL